LGTTIKARLTLSGNFDPAHVTEVLGLEPSQVWRRGDPRRYRTSGSEECDGWVLKLNERESLHLDETLRDLLALIEPVRTPLSDFRKSRDVDVQVAFAVDVVDSRYPSISLSVTQVQKLSEIGASIDIDIL
jgi:hypothetical protein